MGRDAMGLLSLMIGLSEFCNGLWCQDWRFMGPPPVVMSLRQPGGEIQRHYFTIISGKNTSQYIYICTLVFFIPAEPSVVLHIYGREKGRGVALFQANL